MRNQGTFRGFLIVIVVEPAKLKKWPLLQIDWRQKRVHVSVYFISFSHSAYITFRMIMSFRKPCHMSFRKLIPPFTLTGHIRPPPVGRLFIYRGVKELSFIVLGKALWEMACVNGGT